jgi:Holliday junction resolvase-like predicted endonuclease
MEISKSSRHAKITGDLGEYLTLYWLSKHGFESARVDHTGIDIIARHPGRTDVLGISVKSRSRNAGKEESSILIEGSQFAKVQNACEAFCCKPYFALFVDGKDKFFLFILPMSKLQTQLGMNKTVNWKMSPNSIEAYMADPEIAAFELSYGEALWGDLGASQSRPSRPSLD